MTLILTAAVLFVVLGGVLTMNNVPAHITSRTYIAAPRRKPPCKVEPWITYCEEVENYPVEEILHALSNTDITRFLVDESFDAGPFDSEGRPIYPNGPNLPPSPQINRGVDIPTSPHPYSTKNNQPALGPCPPKEPVDVIEDRPRNSKSPYFYERYKRVPTENRPNASLNVTNFSLRSSSKQRAKRQSLENEIPVCASRKVYVYPKAAMCSTSGDWLYLVNINPKMTQLLRVEICNKEVIGQPCMEGHCDTPFNFVSKCEQHYIQKRLVAYVPETGETNIYTSMFWLPSCCVCSTYKIGVPPKNNL